MKHSNEEFWRNKRVFLTGHTGFKGSWLSLWLQKMGAEVCGFALEPSTNPSLFLDAEVGKHMESIIGDVRDFDLVSSSMEKFKPDIVLHMAAQPLVRESYSDPVGTFSINVVGTAAVLAAAMKVSSVKSIVNVTTDKCYENKEWEWAYRENEPLGGHDPYSSSKACSELVTNSFRLSFFNDLCIGVATARAGNVIGGGDWSTDRIIPDTLLAFEKETSLGVRNPLSIRPWQHVLEPLSGYLLLAQRLYESGLDYSEAWNFGPNDEDAKSVGWIADYMASLWGSGASWTTIEGEQAHEATYLRLDISKTKSRLGWKPRWSLKESLENIVDWHKRRLDGEPARELCLSQIEDFISL